MDGNPDVIIDGKYVYFAPANVADIRNLSKWTRMTFPSGGRTPIVVDMDEDGEMDVLVDGSTWYQAPSSGKRSASNWRTYSLGNTSWAMSVIPYDVDKDGDTDIVISDRKAATIWFDHPDTNPYTTWKKRTIHDEPDIRFMKIADIDEDGRDDFIVTCSDPERIYFLRRTNSSGNPTVSEIALSDPVSSFPKGVGVYDYDNNGNVDIFVLNKGNEWMTEYSGNPLNASSWTRYNLDIDGDREKMDDAVNFDIDGDDDMDVITTEENSGQGVIWFENPLY